MLLWGIEVSAFIPGRAVVKPLRQTLPSVKNVPLDPVTVNPPFP